MNVFGLLTAGGVSGLLMGLIGIGGGAVLMPLLLMSGLSLYNAICVVLFIQVVPQTLPALWIYYKKDEFPYKESFVVLVSAVIGTTIGAYLTVNKMVPVAALYKLMSVMLVGFGVYIWYAYV
jgi:uncharacterized membrane protein YfcA